MFDVHENMHAHGCKSKFYLCFNTFIVARSLTSSHNANNSDESLNLST